MPTPIRPIAVDSLAVASLAALVLAAALSLQGEVYSSTKHGSVTSGVFRVPSDPRGNCSHCHDAHGSRDGVSNGGPFETVLFTFNDNSLCLTCHDPAGAHTIYPGSSLWSQSTHAVHASVYWPGPDPPARPSSDANHCNNCHDPHGAEDASGLVPSQMTLREERLCGGCHDGAPARDVKREVEKSYRHPIEFTGKHSAAEGSDPTKVAASPVDNRHAECDDCHNPHQAAADSIAPVAPGASQRLYGVSRIAVSNGSAGTTPIYSWRGPDDLVGPREYEICFKCHSSWTEQPVGQSDLALLTNPANPSFHPIQAVGRNRIDPAAFVGTRTADSIIYCSDCHSSDDATVRGPHGSIYRHIITKPYSASTMTAIADPGDLCFDCHRFDTYANTAAPESTLRASRFNSPSAPHGHAFHVQTQSIPCYSCHVTHGSATQPALIATGRLPGISSYLQTSTGGSCTPTCHVTKSYTVNYAR